MAIPITTMEITGISETGARTVTVIEARSGQEIRLPRSVINFSPGRVIVPVWLMDKIGKYIHANAMPEI